MGSTPTLEVPGYQVVQFLGSGARSTIWQIRDRQTGRLFALKRVVKRQRSDARFLEQATNEYRFASELDHPNVRHIYRLRKVNRWLSLREIHLVMELCDGLTVQENRPESVYEAVRIFTLVAQALAYINGRNIVHADMKPNNVLVAPDGQVKIIDFGQSCRVGTIKERIQGTPDFIAPEQVRRLPLDGRTDVFNFGAALYWTLTGRPIPTVLPKTAGVTFKNDLAITPPEQHNSDVPAPLSKLTIDCIDLNPGRRPQTMSEVAGRLGLIAHTIKRKDPVSDQDVS